jgi:hypothetical protein
VDRQEAQRAVRVIVQWCCRGMGDLTVADVEGVLGGGAGLTCRYWPSHGRLNYSVALARLTEHYLDLHVNHYDDVDPDTGGRVCEISPFISLSAGCVDRRKLLRTNKIHPALRTALDFATAGGTRPGWVFTCWILVGVNRAVGIESVAEEVRELHHARSYSEYYTEGEVAAKINVASRQILCAERWIPAGRRFVRHGLCRNNDFVHPAAVLDERRML